MITPIFRIFDLKKAKEFYVDYLGFTLDWEHQFKGNAPLYMQISMEDVIVHLSEHHGDASPGSTVRIELENLRAFHTKLAEKNYAYMKAGIKKTPWRTEEVTVIDPFYNKIIFFERNDVL